MYQFEYSYAGNDIIKKKEDKSPGELMFLSKCLSKYPHSNTMNDITNKYLTKTAKIKALFQNTVKVFCIAKSIKKSL